MFIFNRNIGSNDESATIAERMEKILFHVSACPDDLEDQLERLSLCEAFIDLCKSLQCDVPCEAVYMDDHQYAMIECEPETWMVVCCKCEDADAVESSISSYVYAPTQQTKAPMMSRLMNMASSSPMENNENIKEVYYKRGTCDGGACRTVFEEESPSTRVLSRLLWSIYHAVVLLHGPIVDILWPKDSADDTPGMIKRLRELLRKSRELQSLKDDGDLTPDEKQTNLLESRGKNEDLLASVLAKSTADRVRSILSQRMPLFLARVDFKKLHMLYGTDALPFMSVDKATFMTIQSLTTLLKGRFQCVKSCVVMYHGELLWSSVSMDILVPIHLFLESHLSNALSQHKSGFLALGNSPLEEHARPCDTAGFYVPQVYLHGETSASRLAVYSFEGLSVLTVLEDNAFTIVGSTLLQFCRELELFVTSEFVVVTDAIATQLATLSNGVIQSDILASRSSRILAQNQVLMDTTERYIYLNEANSVIKISDVWLASVTDRDGSYPTNKQLGGIFAPNVLQTINSIRREFDDNVEFRTMEIIELAQPKRPTSSCWVAAVKSCSRQIFMIIDSKHPFEYVSQRLRTLCDTSFRSILI